MSNKNVWVTSRKNGDWAVKTEGSSKAYRVCDTRKEAEKVGRRVAQNNDVELFVQNKNHKIGSKNSYGNDPNPPKDKDSK
jgi:hypothetical protein